jgi:hypothetical protein
MRNFRIQRMHPTFGDSGVGRASRPVEPLDAIDQDLESCVVGLPRRGALLPRWSILRFMDGCVFLAVAQQVRLTESPVLRRQGRR